MEGEFEKGENTDEVDKPLFRVLGEKKLDSAGGLLGDNKGYEMPDN